MFQRDTLFSVPVVQPEEWRFDERVAEVFPDMIQRSVPGYAAIIEMIGMLAQRFVSPQSTVFDLGCSLGAVSLSVRRHISAEGCQIIAVDNSPAMIERCRRHTKACQTATPIILRQADIREVAVDNASMVILNFALQFLPPDDRLPLLQTIFNGLKPGGVLVLSEKFSFADREIDELLFAMHYDFKRANGYSELEIQQKRRMLKNVMITEHVEVHKRRLSEAGFAHVELWFQCLNFGSLLAIKADAS